MMKRTTARAMFPSLGSDWRLSHSQCSPGCRHSAPANAGLKATAQGTALVESSGGHQVGVTGTVLKDPLVVQVNDDQGTAVPGALVEFHGPAGVSFDPAAVLTDSSGQATTAVTLGTIAGRYSLSATRPVKRSRRPSTLWKRRSATRSASAPFLRTSIAAAATIRSRRPSVSRTTTISRSSRTRSPMATP